MEASRLKQDMCDGNGVCWIFHEHWRRHHWHWHRSWLRPRNTRRRSFVRIADDDGMENGSQKNGDLRTGGGWMQSENMIFRYRAIKWSIPWLLLEALSVVKDPRRLNRLQKTKTMKTNDENITRLIKFNRSSREKRRLTFGSDDDNETIFICLLLQLLHPSLQILERLVVAHICRFPKCNNNQKESMLSNEWFKRWWSTP